MLRIGRCFGVWVRIGVVDEQTHCMGNDIGDGVEGLDTTFGRSGRVHDESFTERPADTPAETPERVHQTHRLGQSGRLALDRSAGSLGREVAWPEPRPTRGDDHAVEIGGEIDDGGTDRIGAVFGVERSTTT